MVVMLWTRNDGVRLAGRFVLSAAEQETGRRAQFTYTITNLSRLFFTRPRP